MSESTAETPVTGEQASGQDEAQVGAPRQDLFSKLAGASEEVISRVAGLPATARALEQAQIALHRLDDLQKRLLGVEALERRVVDLEAKVASLESRLGSGGPS